MNLEPVGISQQTLVSNAEDVPAKRLLQYVAAIAATLGSLSGGLTLGWTSSAGENGIELKNLYHIEISAVEFSWISSLAAVGCAIICILIGILADIIGRKYSMLLMAVPFTIGWLLIILAKSVTMFYIGRFMTGLGTGAFSVLGPIYIAEIAENQIRGALGSYIQILTTIGIFISYVFGNIVDMRILSIISGIIPLIFVAVFVFMPETPIYYLKKGDEESARKSLTRLRGAHYNIENELQSHKNALEENSKTAVSFWAAIKSKAVLKSLVIGFGLMIFQQLSGVNVVIFYTNSIFEQVGSTLESGHSTMIVGAMQVIAASASGLIVDRAGRRILLLLSAIFMCLTTCILGVYFYLSRIKTDVSSIGWLPLVAICIFIIMFNMGFGPIPWTMMGEIFSPEVKGVAASSASLLNWILVFIVTKFFSDLSIAIGIDVTFWLFAVICLIGAFFVYILVPETKGKSLEAIQRELSSGL
ncbi:facilitated trehalose transporter Tret1 [Xylocopa sonorina]|uniref:facilitated trehalose transporter Tret1 n=1 Tax=Xylocopa sonorina TaxID=1818115 RepID=UPI00403AD6D8